MANSYFKIYLHIIFAVKNRESLLHEQILSRVHSYIAGTLQNMHQTVLAVGGIDDHVHILICYNPTQTIPDMMRNLKAGVSKMINQERLVPCRFEWQRGYACFSYAQSQVDTVAAYIRNQYQHHKCRSFDDEMAEILNRFQIEYDSDYIIKSPK